MSKRLFSMVLFASLCACGGRAPMSAAPGQAQTASAKQSSYYCDPTSSCCDGCDWGYQCGCCTPFCQCVIDLCIYP